MQISRMHTEEKPYNRCIDCKFIGVQCDGPNFLAMDIRRLCEWAKLRKDYLHSKDPKWTNAYIAEKSGVSLTTVSRFFGGEVAGLNLATTAAIICVLVNGTWGQYPCAMTEEDDERECLQLREQIAEDNRKIDFLKQQISKKDETISENYKMLKRRGNVLMALCAGLIFSMSVIIAALLVDAYNSSLGFFWF